MFEEYVYVASCETFSMPSVRAFLICTLVHMIKNTWWNCIQTYINGCKIKNWKEGSKNRADWAKSIKKGKVHIGL
jgi:hypothetical protein